MSRVSRSRLGGELHRRPGACHESIDLLRAPVRGVGFTSLRVASENGDVLDATGRYGEGF
jgi:hypothetical protein